jgi:hypothetical protein
VRDAGSAYCRMATDNVSSQFSARAHGPGYWFGSAAAAVAVALAVFVFDLVEAEHVAFWGPLLVAVFAVVQGVRSVLIRRGGSADGG